MEVFIFGKSLSFGLDLSSLLKKGGQAPHTVSYSSGFLIRVGASPRFSTVC